MYEQLASQYSNAVFLKVDVDQHKAIAAKYQVSSMPTFLVIKESGVADMVRGADPHALAAMVSRHASSAAPSASSLPAEAEKAKAEGNAAFAAGQYAVAADHYSRAIKLAPRSAVLHGNRAYTYIKLIKLSDTPKTERQALRPRALQDAERATTLDEMWAKGWIRMAEALVLAGDEEGMEGVVEGKRAEGRMATLAGAQEALENAIRLSDGNVRAGECCRDIRARETTMIYSGRCTEDARGHSGTASSTITRWAQLKKASFFICLLSQMAFNQAQIFNFRPTESKVPPTEESLFKVCALFLFFVAIGLTHRVFPFEYEYKLYDYVHQSFPVCLDRFFRT